MENQEKLVSIIIPAYNVSLYLSDCLNSCLEQTYPFWEAIIVNDGSTDDTQIIAEKFIGLDDRFVLINQENSGQAKAREVGLNAMNGEFVYFLDSDDFLSPKAFELMFQFWEKSKPDIVAHNAYAYFNPIKKSVSILCQKDEMQGLESIKELLMTNFVGVLWGKLFKRHLFDQVVHPVDQIKMGEDTLLLLAVLIQKNPRIQYLDESLYYYRQRETSTTKSGKILGDFMVDYAQKIEEKLILAQMIENVKIEWSKFNLDILLRILIDQSEKTQKVSTFYKKVLKVNYPIAKSLLTWKRKLIFQILRLNYDSAKLIVKKMLA